jgi:hypothetical protein
MFATASRGSPGARGTRSTQPDSTADNELIPPDVALVMSALEAGGARQPNRRNGPRYRYRVLATLRLFSDQQSTPPWLLYTRDISPRGLGFVTAHRLPLGYGGVIELPGPAGEPVSVHCTLLRCREAAPGWFEGSVYFNREQAKFELD